MKALRLLTLACAVTWSAPVQGAAGRVAFGPHDVRSVFYVAKSQNQNQVHYGVHLDGACRPVGKRPVFAYWRRLRDGRRVDGPLEGAGLRVYGASDDQTVTTSKEGGRVSMYVKALKQVRIDIATKKGAEGCEATATTTIQGQPAKLSHAYLQLGLLALRVKYVDVVGHRLADGKRVSQRFD